jgi:hypothetical protein
MTVVFATYQWIDVLGTVDDRNGVRQLGGAGGHRPDVPPPPPSGASWWLSSRAYHDEIRHGDMPSRQKARQRSSGTR